MIVLKCLSTPMLVPRLQHPLPPSPLYPTDPHPPLPTYVYDGSFAPCYGVRTTVLGLAL